MQICYCSTHISYNKKAPFARGPNAKRIYGLWANDGMVESLINFPTKQEEGCNFEDRAIFDY